MNPKNLINFSYNQSQVHPTGQIRYISSQYIINCPKILTFSYQISNPIPKTQKIESFSLATYTPSAGSIQSKREDSSRSSKKINLTISKHLRTKNKYNAFPQSSSAEKQEEQKGYKRLIQDKLLSHPNNYQEMKKNSLKAEYTYVLPNHIKFQFEDLPNCGLFTFCKQTDQRQQVQIKANINHNKNITNSQQRNLEEKQSKHLARQKIFKPQKISQFRIQQAQQQQKSVQKPLFFREIQPNVIKSYTAQQQSPQIKQIYRKHIFQSFEGQKQNKICIINQQAIHIDDIPDFVIKNWQNQPISIKQQKYSSFHINQTRLSQFNNE